jgi:hypothetical protein
MALTIKVDGLKVPVVQIAAEGARFWAFGMDGKVYISLVRTTVSSGEYRKASPKDIPPPCLFPNVRCCHD